jgi:quinol-cytochrome oxidoreductase complex cytochrome b subunit
VTSSPATTQPAAGLPQAPAHNVSRRPSFFEHLHPPTIPAREARFRYTFGLGGISLFLFLVLCATGVLELFHYIPTAEDANASTHVIDLLVPYGWVVRGLHYWAGQGIVVTAALHLVRIVLTGSYRPPRRFNWLLGLALLVAMLLLDFTGLVLRWDMDIAWALMVGTNLLASVPLLGPALYALAVGGSEIGQPTVIRFLAWHIFGLALPAGILIGWHLFRVRRDGGISHVAPNPDPAPATQEPGLPERIPRSELLRRESIAALVVGALLLVLTILAPPGLGARADFANLPPDASAPWFFLWVQQLLRLGEAFSMGVAIPCGVLIVLALVPYVIDRRKDGTGRWFNRQGRLAQTIVLGILALIAALIVRGAIG